jgi:hypothetical protein
VGQWTDRPTDRTGPAQGGCLLPSQLEGLTHPLLVRGETGGGGVKGSLPSLLTLSLFLARPPVTWNGIPQPRCPPFLQAHPATANDGRRSFGPPSRHASERPTSDLGPTASPSP